MTSILRESAEELGKLAAWGMHQGTILLETENAHVSSYQLTL